MNVIKSGGTIIGAKLTNAERKAMNIEIQKELAEYERKHAMEVDAIVLWTLRKVAGWGPERLRRFYDAFAPEFDALLDRYDMDAEDGLWLCTKELRDYGIDLEQWEKERN